jgi:AcrR family transcriptional regulator
MDIAARMQEPERMSEAIIVGMPLVGDAQSPGLPPAFRNPQQFDETKVRLIVAGEALFAEESIQGVSMREIAVAAGNGNNNAVQYHFGDKEGLMQAIFAYRVWQMDQKRRTGWEALKASGRKVDFRALLELLCLPLLDLTNEAGRHSYAGFINKYMLYNRTTGIPHAMDSRTESTATLRQLNVEIEARLANLPSSLIINRIALAYLMFVNMLVRADNNGVSARGGVEFQQCIEDCLTMATAALGAPAPNTVVNPWD